MFDNSQQPAATPPSAMKSAKPSILYVHQNVYVRGTDGTVYAEGQFDMTYWSSYLAITDHLVIASHCRDATVDDNLARLNKISDPRIHFLFLPRINSPLHLHRIFTVRKLLRTAMQAADLLVLRTYSEPGYIAWKLARKAKLPFVMEMAGCPFDNTWNHGTGLHALPGKIAAPIRMLRTQQMARTAMGVLYVTRDFLPRRYPTGGIKAVASNVRLDAPDALALQIRDRRPETDTLQLGIIGGLEHGLKGIPVAIEAIGRAQPHIRQAITLHLLGQGSQAKLNKLAEKWQVNIICHGVLPAGAAVRDWLDQLDLYLQPSFHEGLPRATLEAMSRGLPVLASSAGGLPEIVPASALHKPGDVDKLVEQLMEFSETSKAERLEQGTRYFHVAAKYTADRLEPVRTEFWQRVVRALPAYIHQQPKS